MPAYLTREPSELDGVYVRAMEAWEADREKFEHEQPLLARAFTEQKPGLDQAQALAVFGRRVQDLESQLKNQQADMDARSGMYEERVRILKRDLADAQHRGVVLAEELRDRNAQIQSLSRKAEIEGPEADRLAARGWKKEIV